MTTMPVFSAVSRQFVAPASVRGRIIQPHVQWVREQRLESEVAELWRALDPEISRGLSTLVLSSAWYPLSWLVAVDEAIEELFDDGDGKVLGELGRYSARLNLSVVQRLLYPQGPHEFLRQSAIRFSQFHDFASALYERHSDHQGTMTHRHYVPGSSTFCAVMAGYYEQILALCGARRTSVEHADCQVTGARACVFEMRWA